MLTNPSKFNFTSSEEEARYEALVGPPGHWQQRRDIQLKFLADLGLPRGVNFLDLGCGSLRLGLPLIDYLETGRYVGVDVDPDCIGAAEHLLERFSLSEKAPQIVHSDSFGVEELLPARRFDRIWAFQVFIHLTEDLTREGLEAIAQLLAEDGIAWITLRIDEGLSTFTQTGHWREKFAVSSGPLRYYKQACETAGLSLKVVGEIDTQTPAGWVKPPRSWLPFRKRGNADRAGLRQMMVKLTAAADRGR